MNEKKKYTPAEIKKINACSNDIITYSVIGDDDPYEGEIDGDRNGLV